MYQHLLVPVDGTQASDLNVERAVNLAAVLQAKVTFMHATANFASTEDGAILRSVDPTSFAELIVGDTHAILVRAKAAAAAKGVPCEQTSGVSDATAEAIVEAAVQRGCDLIVLASHGIRPGLRRWLAGSTIERVLRQSPIAVLVTRPVAQARLQPQERAMGVIRSEHRSLAAIAMAMRDLSEEFARGQTDADSLELLAGMLAYLREFPRHEHHPKEELYLHVALRSKHPDAESLLVSLESQHQHEYAACDEAAMLVEKARSAAVAVRDLAEPIAQLARGLLSHIAQEEREVFPLAFSALDSDDWTRIASAFEQNTDIPLQDIARSDWRHVFRRIANRLAAKTL